VGNVELGHVVAYDPATMTATIVSADGASKYRNVGIMMQSCDYGSGSYQFNPPAVGSVCMFTQISGEVLIIGSYLPPNMAGEQDGKGFADTIGDKSTLPTTTNAVINRAPGDFPNKSSLPGDWRMTGKSGSEISFMDMLFSVKMAPTFYSIWNLLNKFWDTVCNKFRFRSPACDVFVDVNDSQETDVNIVVRQTPSERSGTPAINLKLGKEAGVVDLKINGQDFLKVDLNRNVTLEVNTMTVRGNLVTMEDVQLVKLPF
jgi:hypothetical protein